MVTKSAAPKAWYSTRRPDEIQPIPWLHPEAIRYLEGLLSPDMWVLEHGAGGSTLWFAERVKSVTSIEHKIAWQDKVKELAPANVTIINFIPADWGTVFDLFFIDGERDERRQCLRLAHELIRPGGWVILDNANRPEYIQERMTLAAHAKLIARFDNNIPGFSMYFVTEFWQLCE